MDEVIKTTKRRIGISGEYIDAVYKSSILHFMAEKSIDLVVSPACLELISFFRAIKATNSIQIDEAGEFKVGYGEQGKWSLPLDIDTNYREYPEGWIINYICDNALLPRIEQNDWFGLFAYILPNLVITRYHSIFIGDIEEKELMANILSATYGLKAYFWNKNKSMLENALLAKECFYRLVPYDYQAAILTILGIPAIIVRANNNPENQNIFKLPTQAVCEQNNCFYQITEYIDCFNPGSERSDLLPSVCICIPTICCADLLKASVENILPQLRANEKVLIVDNGNQGIDKIFDPSLVNVIVTEKNLGVSGSWNKLLRTAFAEYPAISWALVLNDDIQLAQRQLRKIRQELFFSEKAEKWFVNGPYERSVFAIHRKCIEKVGYFDEEIYPAFMEDDDYYYRINLVDSRLYRSVDKAFEPEIKRKRTSTTRKPELDIYGKNYAYYVKKWGGGVGQETYKIPFGSS